MFLSNMDVSGKAVERIREELSRKLEAMPGLSSILDVYSMREYDRRFIELFVKEPGKTYRILEKVFAGDRDSINFILRYLLRTFTHNDELINKIIDELSRGNDKLLKKVIYGREFTSF